MSLATLPQPIPLCHEVHGSELKAFDGCRRRWNWSYRQGYTPPVVAKPLQFGTAWHVAMETMYDPQVWSLPIDDFVNRVKLAFIAETEHQRGAFMLAAEKYVLDPEEAADYDKRLELGLGMLGNLAYVIDRDAYTPIATEQEVLIPIKYPDGRQMLCRCDHCWRKYLARYKPLFQKISEGDPNVETTTAFGGTERSQITIAATKATFPGLPVYYGIRIDALVQDREGAYWLVETKTAAQLDADDTFLELEFQCTSYLWVIRQILGLNVRGFIYVQHRKEFPHPPKRLLNERLGCNYSVSKQQLTDYPTFLAYVLEHDKAAVETGNYDDFLNWLKTDGKKFVQWFPIRRTPTQLDNVGKDIVVRIGEQLRPHLAIYPSPGRMQCRRCAFQEPCLLQTAGHDYEHLLASAFEIQPPYYERERARRASVSTTEAR